MTPTRGNLAVALLTFGLGAVLPGVEVARAADPVATCTSSVGSCENEYLYDYGSYTETYLRVFEHGSTNAVLVTIVYPGSRSLTVDFQRNNPPQGCSASQQCENGELLECEWGDPTASCGSNGHAVWCGAFYDMRGREWLEAEVRTCRGLADPWPEMPKPKPSPPPQSKPGAKKKKPLPAEGCTPEKIRRVNSVDRNYINTIHAVTTPPGSHQSEIVVRHVPGRTSILGKVFAPKGVETYEAVLLGQTMHVRSPMGGWMKMSASAMPETARGGGAAAFNHELYGPPNMVKGFTADQVEYYGIGPCEGTLHAGAACFSYGFMDDGKPNNAYFAVDDCRMVSVVGEDKNGPRTFVIEYPRELEVADPAS